MAKPSEKEVLYCTWAEGMSWQDLSLLWDMTTTPGLKIVVERPADAELIRSLLGRDLAAKVRFFAGQGLVSLATVGRNILVQEGGPVLLVMDSDTLNLRRAEELRSLAMIAMSGASQPPTASPGMVHVFTFVPSIEAIFFEAPEALERILGRKVDKEVAREGAVVPKETLKKLVGDRFGTSFATPPTRFDLDVVPGIASGEQAKNLRKKIESLITAAAA